MIIQYILLALIILVVLWRMFLYFYNAYIAGKAILLQARLEKEDVAITKLDTPEAIQLAYISNRGPDWDGYEYEAALDKLTVAKDSPAA